MSISTHYQPIISLAHRRVVGYEALLRAKRPNGEFCPPLEAFEHAREQGRAEQFDRLCLANHLKHFAPIKREDQWLFLNLSSDTINPQNHRAELITKRLAKQGLQPQNIVLEILEDAAKDGEQLKDFVHYYRDAGF